MSTKEVKKYEFSISDISDSYPRAIEFECNQELKDNEKVQYEMLFIKSIHQIGSLMRDRLEEKGEATEKELDKVELIDGARVYFSILMDVDMTVEDKRLIQRNKAELICNQIRKKNCEFSFVLSDKVKTKLGM